MIRTMMLTAALIAFLMFGAAYAQDSTFTDPRDGQKYRTVTIGDLVWMAENLKFRPKTDNTWCYGNDNSNCEKYGRLYVWNAAMNACPAPWRLPTDKDWDDLVGEIDDEDDAGVTLRSKAGWSNDGNGTDKLGFSALPGGYRSANDGHFYDAGSRGSWWSATERGRGIARVSDMDSGDSELSANNLNKSYGLSVRCTRDGAVQSPAAGVPAAKTAPVTPPPAQHVTAPATSFTDPRDGQTYRVVKIGKLTWMAENLKFRPKIDNTWCSGHDNSNCDKYGRLYTWDAAMASCPDGWRLPANGDWDDLVLAADGKNKAGGTLKSKAGWSKDGNGSDKIGFSALPGGYQHGGSGAINRSYDLGSRGYWWSATKATEYGSFYRWYREISSDGSEVSEKYYAGGQGFSVRCAFDGVFQSPATGAAAGKAAAVTPPPAAPPQPSTFTDPRDDRKYSTVTIGDLVWMAQNLNFRPQNEDELDEDDVETWCLNNDKSNCDKYGRLYTWHAAMAACPAGWRLPTKEDWEKLVWEADGKDAAGSRLKSTSGWYKNVNGTDKFGFSALPGGKRFRDRSFGGDKGGGFWWTSTERKPREAYYRVMSSHWAGEPTSEVEGNDGNKYDGMSVRCARDAAAQSPATGASAPQPAAKTAPVTPPPAASPSGTFTDPRDGQTYRTVKIGKLTWMAQNLNYIKPQTEDNWCYDNDNSNCGKYGRLYTWNAAMNACPAGWRLPTKDEWGDLIWETSERYDADIALKSKTGWRRNGTDRFGFSALPGGRRLDDGRFYRVGSHGVWWSATVEYHSGPASWSATVGRHSNLARYVEIESNDSLNSIANYYTRDISEGSSVRCIRDVTAQRSATGASASKPAAQTAPVTPPPAASSPSSPFTDSRDGQTYRTVRIGNKTWMAQNINYKTKDSWWCYGNDNSNCDKYGKLYTWDAAMEACSAPWRLPSNKEWDELLWAEGNERFAGNALKSKTGWSGDGNGTDKFGFSALPGGYRNGDSRYNDTIRYPPYSGLGSMGHWWSATKHAHSGMWWSLSISSAGSGVGTNYSYNNSGLSVRCIRD